jgi:HlyD family secretion protein
VAQAEAAREGAKALLAQAEARRALLAAGPTETQRAEAQAAVDQARAALQAAQATLAQAELRSPIQGTVTAVAIRRGEFAVAGTPVVTVGDLSHLQVETTDLNEVDVARVRVGQEVTLTFDALPAKSLRGRVVRIAPMASGQGGGVNYTVTIELEEQDPALRWGMTAFVDILVEQK